MSRQGSLGEDSVATEGCGLEAALGEGLHGGALPLSNLGEASGEPLEGNASCEGLMRLDEPYGRVGVCEPEADGD